jgi:hypothetical protein
MVDRKEIVVDGITYVQKELPEPSLNTDIHFTTLKVRKNQRFNDSITINFGVKGQDYTYNHAEFLRIIHWFERVRDAYFPGGKRFDA